MTLYERLLPQAREMLENARSQFPATTTTIMEQLHDKKYYSWTELPYSTVKMMHERVFNSGCLDAIEEEEVRQMFSDYYE